MLFLTEDVVYWPITVKMPLHPCFTSWACSPWGCRAEVTLFGLVLMHALGSRPAAAGIVALIACRPLFVGVC